MPLSSNVFLTKYSHTCLLLLVTISFKCLIPFSMSSILVSASHSGIFADNSRYQTVVNRLLNAEEKMAASAEILGYLGLHERPKIISSNASLQNSPTRFLLDVYDRFKVNDNNDAAAYHVVSKRDLLGQENFITDLNENVIKQSNTIMTYLSKNVEEVATNEAGHRLWFNVTEVPDDNKLVMAELRLYQNSSQAKWSSTDKEFTITVYTVVKRNGDEKELEIISSINTKADYQGWLELNVTEGFSFWLQNQIGNQTIYIEAYDVAENDRIVNIDEIGLVHMKLNNEYEPFLTAYFQAPEFIKGVQKLNHRKRKTYAPRSKTASEETGCRRQSLRVHFKELGVQDWIIFPEFYNAFYCGGECSYYMPIGVNITNHGIIQSLLHATDPEKVPAPSCVPTKLSELTVLYKRDSENICLKTYKNMVVESCGCH